MKKLLLALLCSCCIFPAHAAVSDFHVYGESDTLADWGALPFDVFSNQAQWPERPEVGGFIAYSHIAMGVSYAQWGVERIRRDQIFATFHEDVIDVFVDEQNQLQSGSLSSLLLNAGRTYNMQLCLDYLSANGVRFFGPAWRSKRLEVKWAVNMYDGQDFFDGCLQGSVNPPFDSALSLKSSFSRDLLLNQENFNASGFGASLDLGAHWKIWRSLYINTRVQDLLGRVQWSRAGTAQAQVSANFSPQPQGKNNYFFEPNIQGRYQRDSHLQHLPVLSQTELGYSFASGFSLYGSLRTTPVLNYAYLGTRYNWRRDLYLQAAYQLEPGGISLLFSSRWFQFGLLTNAIRLREANQLAVFAKLGLP